MIIRTERKETGKKEKRNMEAKQTKSQETQQKTVRSWKIFQFSNCIQQVDRSDGLQNSPSHFHCVTHERRRLSLTWQSFCGNSAREFM